MHIPKTGGTSCRRYLAEAFAGAPFHVYVVAARFASPAPNVIAVPGHPHRKIIETLKRAATYGIKNPSLVCTLIRNPYAWEVSSWAYKTQKERAHNCTFDYFIRNKGGFRSFGQWCGNRESFHPGLRIFKLEEIGALKEAVEAVGGKQVPFPHDNDSDHPPPMSLYTHELEEIVYQKHKRIFDMGFYSRQRL
jgi:hypothetical protein